MSNTPKVHSVSFEKNRLSPDLWRARCSCGWAWLGQREDVHRRAAGHDMEWEAADPVAEATAPAEARP